MAERGAHGRLSAGLGRYFKEGGLAGVPPPGLSLSLVLEARLGWLHTEQSPEM